ncbi:MAG: VOC family protein [Oceanicaulis sp.]
MTLDHLVFAHASLDEGAADVQRRLGVTAEPGGRHERIGTHNRLIGLGSGPYLEILAPDPDALKPGPTAARLARLRDGGAALCFQSAHLDELEGIARAAGFATRGPEDWSRRGANGETLAWRLLFVSHPALGGADPFFIDWGETRRPSQRLAQAAQLVDYAVVNPEPDRAHELYSRLGLALKVSHGVEPALQITLAAGQMTARSNRQPFSLF